MKSMKLRNLKKLWVLCGVAFMAMPVAAGCICSLPMEQTESGDAISEEQRQELNMLRKKYKLPSPKANAREIETAKIQVQLARLNRVDEHTVTGTAFAKNGKVTLQQARDLGKTVRALATAVEQEGGSARKEFNLFLDYLFTQQVIESVPKYKYSNYNDVRKVPADLLSALSVCDDWRKARLIAAVQNLLEAEQLHWDAEDIRNHVNSDYLFNVTPHLFVCAVHHPDDEVAVKELSAFSRFLSACTQYSPGGKDVLKPDGTGFHHNSHYNGYMYSYKTWVEYMGRLKGTSFRIDKEAYQRMKKAVVSLYLMAVRSESDNDLFFAGVRLSGGKYLLDRTEAVEGVNSPSTIFNAMFSPSSMAEANRSYIGACTDKLSFASSDGNSEVTIGGRKENRDIATEGAIFSVKSVSFETPDTELPESLNGLVTLHHAGKDVTGFISDVDFRYTKRKAAEYTIMVKE